MKHIVALMLVALAGSTSIASAQIRQSGNAVPGHALKFTAPNVAMDAGGAAGGAAGTGLTELGITKFTPTSLPPFCINSAPINSSTGYYQVCLDPYDATQLAPVISFQSLGGATQKTPVINQNGTIYPLTSAGGNITGPVSPITSGHLVMANGGNTIADAMGTNTPCPAVLGCATVPGLNMPSGLGIRRTTTGATDINDVLISRIANYTGGTPGFVNVGLNVATQVNAGVSAFEWNALFQLANSSTSADGGESVALFAASRRLSSGPTWAAVFNLSDKAPIPSGVSAVSVEIDKEQWDTDPFHGSAILNLVGYVSTGAPGATVISYGMEITGASPSPTFWKGINLSSTAPMTYGIYSSAVGTASNGVVQASTAFIADAGSWGVGLDLHAATYSTAAIWLPNNGNLFFNTTGTESLWYNPSTTCTNYTSSGTVIVNFCGGTARMSVGSAAPAPATTVDVYGTFRVTQASPASGAACSAGQIVADTGFIYTCASTGVWKRVAVTGGY